STLLFSQTLEISQAIADQLKEPGTGLYFDWGPDSSRYLTHVENRRPGPDGPDFLDFLNVLRDPPPRESPTSTEESP
ncbi:MAG TPA: hypothetical protein VKA04_12280, partial [Pseudodesulfovibrio sp.]|nr:hypothetical protein [Pseudodesulfovibrio sp.]